MFAVGTAVSVVGTVASAAAGSKSSNTHYCSLEVGVGCQWVQFRIEWVRYRIFYWESIFDLSKYCTHLLLSRYILCNHTCYYRYDSNCPISPVRTCHVFDTSGYYFWFGCLVDWAYSSNDGCFDRWQWYYNMVLRKTTFSFSKLVNLLFTNKFSWSSQGFPMITQLTYSTHSYHCLPNSTSASFQPRLAP